MNGSFSISMPSQIMHFLYDFITIVFDTGLTKNWHLVNNKVIAKLLIVCRNRHECKRKHSLIFIFVFICDCVVPDSFNRWKLLNNSFSHILCIAIKMHLLCNYDLFEANMI